MALSQATPIVQPPKLAWSDGVFPGAVAYPMDADTVIWEGAAVSIATGTVQPLSTDNVFVGFARESVSNAGGAAGAKLISIIQEGMANLTITGLLSSTEPGTLVYASAEDAFTLTAGSNLAIGRLVKYLTGTTGIVFFQGIGIRSV